jgi:hypothetical protein
MGTTRTRFTPQAVLGLLIIAAGLLLTVENLGWYDADRILRFWPLGIVVVGLVKLWQGEGSGKLVGVVIIFVGSVLTADKTFGLPVDIGDVWPLALVIIGVVILSRTLRPSRPSGPLPGEDVHTDDRFPGPGMPPSDLPGPGEFGSPGPDAGRTPMNDASVSEVAVWAGKQRRVADSSFRRADLTAIMGGVELDLRAAGTASGEAVIDVFVMWGGIEIWVPPSWAVVNKVGVLMGGVEDKSTGTQDARHRLIVRGFVVMGGMEIKT